MKSCMNCRWTSCKNYGYFRNICPNYLSEIRYMLDYPRGDGVGLICQLPQVRVLYPVPDKSNCTLRQV